MVQHEPSNPTWGSSPQWGALGSVQGFLRCTLPLPPSVAGCGSCGNQPGGEPRAEGRAEVVHHTRAAGLGRSSLLCAALGSGTRRSLTNVPLSCNRANQRPGRPAEHAPPAPSGLLGSTGAAHGSGDRAPPGHGPRPAQLLGSAWARRGSAGKGGRREGAEGSGRGRRGPGPVSAHWPGAGSGTRSSGARTGQLCPGRRVSLCAGPRGRGGGGTAAVAGAQGATRWERGLHRLMAAGLPEGGPSAAGAGAPGPAGASARRRPTGQQVEAGAGRSLRINGTDAPLLGVEQ